MKKKVSDRFLQSSVEDGNRNKKSPRAGVHEQNKTEYFPPGLTKHKLIDEVYTATVGKNLRAKLGERKAIKILFVKKVDE
jgi:hypothetical protein